MKTILTRILTKIALLALKKLAMRVDNRLDEALVRVVQKELEI